MGTFHFKQFSVQQSRAAMKVGTDAMVLGALCHFPQPPATILDIGTGTGVLALMLAQRFQPAQVVAIELDPEACNDAQLNFNAAPFHTTFKLHHGSITNYSAPTRFDAIISNPPFFDNSSKGQHAERNQARHTDTLTTEELLDAVARNLSEQGLFWVILPADKRMSMEQLAASKDLFLKECITISGKPNKIVRIILCFGFHLATPQERQFTIRTEMGDYTEEYKKATLPFHGVTL